MVTWATQSVSPAEFPKALSCHLFVFSLLSTPLLSELTEMDVTQLVLAYADDKAFFSSSLQGMQAMLDKAHSAAASSRMHWNAKKCHLLVLQAPAGESRRVLEPLRLGSEPVEWCKSATYLGVKVESRYSSGCTSFSRDSPISSARNLLKAIWPLFGGCRYTGILVRLRCLESLIWGSALYGSEFFPPSFRVMDSLSHILMVRASGCDRSVRTRELSSLLPIRPWRRIWVLNTLKTWSRIIHGRPSPAADRCSQDILSSSGVVPRLTSALEHVATGLSAFLGAKWTPSIQSKVFALLAADHRTAQPPSRKDTHPYLDHRLSGYGLWFSLRSFTPPMKDCKVDPCHLCRLPGGDRGRHHFGECPLTRHMWESLCLTSPSCRHLGQRLELESGGTSSAVAKEDVHAFLSFCQKIWRCRAAFRQGSSDTRRFATVTEGLRLSSHPRVPCRFTGCNANLRTLRGALAHEAFCKHKTSSQPLTTHRDLMSLPLSPPPRVPPPILPCRKCHRLFVGTGGRTFHESHCLAPPPPADP